MAHVGGEAERGRDPAEHRDDGPRRDPAPALPHGRPDEVELVDRADQEHQHERPARDVPDLHRQRAQPAALGPPAAHLRAEPEREQPQHGEERDPDRQQDGDAARPPERPVLAQPVDAVERLHEGLDRVRGGPDRDQDAGREQPAVLPRHQALHAAAHQVHCGRRDELAEQTQQPVHQVRDGQERQQARQGEQERERREQQVVGDHRGRARGLVLEHAGGDALRESPGREPGRAGGRARGRGGESVGFRHRGSRLRFTVSTTSPGSRPNVQSQRTRSKQPCGSRPQGPRFTTSRSSARMASSGREYSCP